MDYKGYRIDIVVVLEQPEPTFRATFEIRTGMGTNASTGTIAGLTSKDEAERLAQDRACRWIDQEAQAR